MFEHYISAISEKNDQLAEFLFRRFRPEMKVAMEAWLATQPLKNPSAPPAPFTVIDVAPTVLEAAGIPEPTVVNKCEGPFVSLKVTTLGYQSFVA
jgi:hypothetical protein